jgi:probable F420-dependent oxidoreductase
VRLGLAVPHYDTSFGGQPVSWAHLKEVARTAERAGFDSLWVSDHLFLDWGKYGGPSDPQGSLECFTSMGALAASTDRLRIGSLTVCNDLRPPALVAKMIATLDVLSDGRIDLGLGGGWYEPEYAAAGIEFDRAGIRIERLGEAVQICARMLSGEDLTFTGKHYKIDGALCRPGAVQQPRPPVWVGGKGDKLLAQAAGHADGWNFSWLGSFDTYRERSEQADRACEAVGRDPRDLRRSVGAYSIVGHDEADAKSRYERLVERTPPGVLTSSNGGPGVSWSEFREKSVSGTVDEVGERLVSLAELGVEEVILSLGALPFQVADLADVELAGHALSPVLHRTSGGN